MWPFSPAFQLEPSACGRCSDLRQEYEIRTPGELRQAIRVARDNLADGALRDMTPPASADVDFAQLCVDGPWPDFVEHYFECATCGWRFRLAVDTYHGYRGGWEPYRPTSHRA